jgi:hypothetical protein
MSSQQLTKGDGLMKPLHFTFVALTSVLFGSAIWSCNMDETPTEPAEMRSAQEQQSPQNMPSAGGEMMDQLSAGCPMVIQGADVSVTDTEGGVALAFTTGTGDVADLRTRVQHMAQMYERHHGQAGMMWHRMGGEGMGHRGGPGMGGEGMDHMAGRGPMPAASTTLADTDLGARLELRPSDASQLGALREHVRRHQQRMQSGECWMLQGQPTASLRGDLE